MSNPHPAGKRLIAQFSSLTGFQLGLAVRIVVLVMVATRPGAKYRSR
jgi:hypothetical protein